jgi:hypothetical protein
MIAILFAICLALGCCCLRLRFATALKIGLVSLFVSALIVGWLTSGPRDYMLHLPESLRTIFHPWILGSIAFLTGMFAATFIPMVLVKGAWNYFRSSSLPGEQTAHSRLAFSLLCAAIACAALFFFFFAKTLFVPAKDTSVFYRHVSVDPKSLRVTFLDPVPALPTPHGDFYWPFYGNGGCDVNHFSVNDPSQAKVRYNALNLTGSGTLQTRTKDQLLWRSQWGSVYSNTFFEYRPAYPTDRIPMRVSVYDNNFESEPPTILSAPIPNAATLEAIVFIRVFEAPEGARFVIASYKPNGTLVGTNEYESRGGNWYQNGDGTWIDRINPSTVSLCGIPRSFPVQDYLRSKVDLALPSFASTSKPLADCVSFYYDRNFLVAQDVFQRGTYQSSVLGYKRTYEDDAVSTDSTKIITP